MLYLAFISSWMSPIVFHTASIDFSISFIVVLTPSVSFFNSNLKLAISVRKLPKWSPSCCQCNLTCQRVVTRWLWTQKRPRPSFYFSSVKMESPSKMRSLSLVHHVLPCKGRKSAQGLANLACGHLYIVLLYSN